MTTKTRSSFWIWFRIFLYFGLASIIGAICLVTMGIIKIGQELSTDTTVSFRPKTINDQVQFEMTYGKNITGVNSFTITDIDDRKIWVITGHSNGKPPKIEYGTLPQEPEGAWKQEYPEDGSRPADIRGKQIRIVISSRYNIPFGPGQETTRAEITIPQPPPVAPAQDR